MQVDEFFKVAEQVSDLLNMEKEVKIKDVLNRELRARNQSITSLSRECGIPVSVLHGWCRGTLPSAKNMHMVKKLADHLSIPISVLLFNITDEENGNMIVFSSEFCEGKNIYKITIEKIK